MEMARRVSDGSVRGSRSPAEAVVAAGSDPPWRRPVPPPPPPPPAPRSARRTLRMARAGAGGHQADVRRGAYPHLPLVHNVTGAAGVWKGGKNTKRGGGGEGLLRTCAERTYLVIPLVPSLRDDRFERGELLVGHGQRAKDMLLEQGRAREREEQRRRERLSAVAWRERRIRLARYLLAHVVLQRAERRAVRGGQAVLYLFQALHAQVVAHIESEVPELLLLHERTVFALSFPRGRPHALAPRKFGGGELGGGGHEGFCGRYEGLRRGSGGERLLRVSDGGHDLLWWGVLLLLLLLLLGDGQTYQTVL